MHPGTARPHQRLGEGRQLEPEHSSVAVAVLAQRIHLVRGHKVMLDADLAVLYGVPTKALNQAVKRNAERFPPAFTF